MLAFLKRWYYGRRLKRQMLTQHGVTLTRANEMADELRAGNAKWPGQASVTAFVRKRDRVVS